MDNAAIAQLIYDAYAEGWSDYDSGENAMTHFEDAWASSIARIEYLRLMDDAA